ncbi:peptidylprolyl isomerase [Prochlorococcus sp. MIT 1303]|uniref:peptidylprolyl isomerase n=1 Tax=Prochlorococcus sp. MIT 1303 TaxID=1723647 RepID=UPI0007B3ACF7|nr:peptidylprolyl isomerase [Prochlorococcus sp. MIT 1303]KZR61778.1 Chaperone SurA [Prochlorococcus sp. MIT 1303]
MPTSPLINQLPAEVLQLLARHQLLRPLLNRQLLVDTLSDISVPQEQEQQAMDAYCKEHQLTDEQALKDHLTLAGLSMADLRWRVTLPFRITSYSLENFNHKAEQRFLERKEQLDQVMYSLLRIKNVYLARELFLRIAEGEATFAELASDYSEGKEKAKGGSIGPVPLCQAHPRLVEALRSHAPGTLVEPFQISDWWLVVRVDRYMPVSFDETIRKSMCRELFQEWRSEELNVQCKALTGTLQS